MILNEQWLRLDLHLEIKSGLEVTKSESFVNILSI